MKIVDNAEAKL